jgi:segregation and condensation protein A
MTTKHYRVNLEIFEGPLDLLLYLIKKNDLDILNIEISKITKEYIEYLELMKELNLEIVGEFLVMASTLMQIKAKSLLPSAETAEEEAGPDPRRELVEKLLEYQKFKEAATFLRGRSEEFQNVFYRGAPAFEEREKSLNIRIFDLLGTLREVLDRAEDEGRVVQGEEFPIEDKIEKVLKMLERKPFIKLIDVFEGERRRRSIITCFMALLELIKSQKVFARQDDPYGPILIYKKEAPAEELSPVWPGAEVEAPAAASTSETETPPEGAPAADGAAAEASPAEPGAEASPQENAGGGRPPWRKHRRTEPLGEIDPEAAAAAKRYLEERAAKEEFLARQPKEPEEFALPPDRPPLTAGREAPATVPDPDSAPEPEDADLLPDAAEADPVEEPTVVETDIAAEGDLPEAADETTPIEAEIAPEAADEPESTPKAEILPEEAPSPESGGDSPTEAQTPPEPASTPEAETLPEEAAGSEDQDGADEPVPIDNTRQAWADESGGQALETAEEDGGPEPEMNFTDEPGASPGGEQDDEENRDDRHDR